MARVLNRPRALSSALRPATIMAKRFVSASSLETSLLDEKPADFVKYMKKNGIKRCSVVFDATSQKVHASSELMADLKLFCEADKIDYKNHEGFFMEVGKRSGALLGAFIWRTNRGQAVG